MALRSGSRRRARSRLPSAFRAVNLLVGGEEGENRHGIGAKDRGAGREESHRAARRRRAVDARGGLRRGDVAAGRREGGAEAAVGALLLPHDGGPVTWPCSAGEPSRGSRRRPRRWSRRSRCGRCGGTARTRGSRAFTIEFMALASHREELRAEFARYGELFRQSRTTGADRRAAALRHRRDRRATRRVGGVRDEPVAASSSWRRRLACRRGTPRRWSSSRPGCGGSRASRPRLRRPSRPHAADRLTRRGSSRALP